LVTPKMENAAPTRHIDLRDIVEPKCKKSKTDSADPKRANDRNDNALPIWT
jgi:hypothetical protein